MGERRELKNNYDVFYPQRVCSLIYMEFTWSASLTWSFRLVKAKLWQWRSQEDGSQEVNNSLNKKC